MPSAYASEDTRQVAKLLQTEVGLLQVDASAPGQGALDRITHHLLAYLWLVGNGAMVVIVVIIVPHSSTPYKPKVS